MKTIKFVLFATMVLAGTSVFAQRNNNDNDGQKKDKNKTEIRSENKESQNRRSRDNMDSRKGENREIVVSEKGRVRYNERRENRDERDERNVRNDRNAEYRERRNDRYDNRNEYNVERRDRHDDACPLCYRARSRNGFAIHYSASDLARIETQRLVVAIDLTDRQIDKIYRINLKYLSRRPGNHFYAMERREKDIRNVLRRGQVQDYEFYLGHMDNNEFCNDCQAGWGDSHFRIAFKINL